MRCVFLEHQFQLSEGAGICLIVRAHGERPGVHSHNIESHSLSGHFPFPIPGRKITMRKSESVITLISGFI